MDGEGDRVSNVYHNRLGSYIPISSVFVKNAIFFFFFFFFFFFLRERGSKSRVEGQRERGRES